MQKIAEKSKCSKNSKFFTEIVLQQKTLEARRPARGGGTLCPRGQAARPGPSRAPGHLARWPHLWLPLWPIFTPCFENPRGGIFFVIYATVPPPSRFQDRD